MTAPPLTRASLLVRLRDPNDADAWKEFVRLYASVIYGFARKRGLQDADAADLMQEVLRSVAGAVGRLDYDPLKGTFRGWLYSITRNKVYNFLESRRRQARGTATRTPTSGWRSIPAGRRTPTIGTGSTSARRSPGRPIGSGTSSSRPPGRRSGGRPWTGIMPRTSAGGWVCRRGPCTWPRAGCSPG